MIQLSAVMRAADNKPRHLEYQTINELEAALRRHADTYHEKDGPGVVGATFIAAEHRRTGERGVWRRTECVGKVTALILDVDHGVENVERFLDLWSWEHIAWTTWSHGVDGRVCLRVLMPLVEPISSQTYAKLWRWAQERSAGVLDRSCKDPTRLYYTPRGQNPEAKVEPWIKIHEGDRLDPSEIDLAKYVERRPAPKPTMFDHMDTDEDEVVSALRQLSPDCTHDQWVSIGMAVHDATDGSGRGLDIWDSWSRNGGTYKEGECEKRWHSFGPGPVTKATLFGLARDAGWRPEPKEDWRPQFQGASSPPVERDDPGVGQEIIRWPSHVGLAKHIGKRMCRSGQIVEDESQVWQYKDPIWEQVPECELRQEVHRLDMAPVYAGVDKDTGETMTKPLRVSRAVVDGTLNELRSLESVARPSWFVDAPVGVQFTNGFVMVTEDGVELVPSSTHHRQRSMVQWPYNPNEPAPRWTQAMGEWFAGSEDGDQKALFLQEFAGACLAGIATRYAKSVVLLGEGSNGKSLFIETLQAAFPPGCWSSVEPQDFSDEYRLAMLSGKRMNFAADIPATEIVSSSAFKAVVSGDVITARHIRQDPFQFRPQAGHMFSANALPRTRDYSRGFWRRFVVVEFGNEFAINPMLGAELRFEAPGVTAWALRGLERLLKAGAFTVPASSVKVLDQWRTDSDVVAIWLEERAELDDQAATQAKILWENFKEWTEENRYRPMGSRTFYERLKNNVGTPKRSRSGMLYPIQLSVIPGGV